ncbi:MAG: 6,7-dimethyl-8-ribityllumazine synthase [Bacteroidales bacterium]|nr:6,7-dimethyl-8-ribityllumazine synthase [Bacteroidales bacterium]
MKKTNLSDHDPSTVPSGEGKRFAIVAAEWNPEVTDAMLQGAVDTLREHHVSEEDIRVYRVPGTFELTTAADTILRRTTVDAVICIGCVIQGETRHFEFICQAVSQGLTNVSLQRGRPVIFSVLTTDTMQQALDRAGGRHGNKGVEGAVAALKMVALADSIEYEIPF